MGSGGSKRKSNSESSPSKDQRKREDGKSEPKDKAERDQGATSAPPTAGGEKDKVATQEAIDGKNGTTTNLEDGGERDSHTATVEVTLRPKAATNSAGRRISFYDTVDAAEILPYLVIGNLASARNPGFLKGKHVGFILNLTTEGEAAGGAGRRSYSGEMGIEQLQVEIEDDEDEEISGHFDICFEFIRRAKVSQASSEDKKKHVAPKVALVHSNYGLSRTSAIVLAYLMKEKQWSLREANEHLRKCHSSAKPNDGFLVQLLRYEQELHGKMSMTLKDFYQQP